jgi:sugar lactone lactonase YvrE
MSRFAWAAAAVAIVVSALVVATPAASPNFPPRVDFPADWRAEGIAVGRGHTFYAGDSTNGAIYAGDLRTGEGSVLVPGFLAPEPRRSVLGVFVDNRNRIFAAGGTTCHAYVYDAASGALIKDYTLTAPPCFINDLVVTRTGAYFTNTNGASVLFKIPIGPNGELGEAGDYTYTTTPAVPNTNGIDATADGKTLITIKFTLGVLVKVDADTGAAHDITLTENGLPASVPRGDGLSLRGTTLYVVQNMPNAAFPGINGIVTVIKLSPDFSSGRIVHRLNDPASPLVNPATGDLLGQYIFVVTRNTPFATPTFNYLRRLDTHGHSD